MPRRNLEQVTIVRDISRPITKAQIGCDLTPEELQAIGLITVQWAHLKHCLLARTCQIAEQLGIPPPQECQNFSFTKRLRAFRDVSGKLPRQEASKWRKVVDRIANAEGQRHKVTHGLWVWDSSQEDDLVALVSLRPPHKFDMRISLPKLGLLGRDVGELLFELTFPGGLAEAITTIVPSRPRPKNLKVMPFASRDKGKK